MLPKVNEIFLCSILHASLFVNAKSHTGWGGNHDLLVHIILIFPCISVYFRGRTELGDVTVHNIKQLKRLNQVVFPVTYNDKFYKDVLEVGDLAKLGKAFKGTCYGLG